MGSWLTTILSKMVTEDTNSLSVKHTFESKTPQGSTPEQQHAHIPP